MERETVASAGGRNPREGGGRGGIMREREREGTDP